MKKRFFSWLLAAAMCFSLLPQVALAEEESIVRNEQEEMETDVSNEADADVSAVQAMIDALPSVEEVSEGDYDAVQAAYDAYDALTAEQQAQISGADCFGVLFGWFNGQIAVLEDDTSNEAVAKVTMTTSDGIINEAKYTDLLEAFKAAKLGRFTDENQQNQDAETVVVELLKSKQTYTLDSTDNFPISFEYSHSVTVDLNGCTLKRSVDDNTHGILKVEKGNVTLKNGKLDFTVSTYNNPRAIEIPGGVDASTTLTLEKDMTITVTGTPKEYGEGNYAGIAIYAGAGNLNIKGGTYGEVQIHSANVKLSGGEYAEVDHLFSKYDNLLEKGYIFMQKDENGEYTKYIDPATMSSNYGQDANIKNLKVIKCGHQGATFVDGECDRCGYVCKNHTFNSGNCGTCGQKIVANDSFNYYVSLSEAFERIANGRKVYVIEKLPQTALVFNYDKEVELEGLGSHYLEGSDSSAMLTVSSGKLTMVPPLASGYPATVINNGSGYAVSVTGGTLEFANSDETGSTIIGVAVLKGGLQVTGDGKLEGGLKEGSIIKKGSNGNSVSVEGSSNYNDVLGLLDGKQLAFAEYDENAENKAGDLVGGNYTQLTEDVIVVAHPKHTMKPVQTPDPSYKSDIYECDCGFICAHENGFTDGICTTCGAACTHPNVDESNKCTKCNAQMAVKVENGSTTTYYAQTTEYGAESTLKAILNDDTITPSGSKITLLANDLLAWAFVKDGKTITLDLNGKRLTESTQGITVGRSDQGDTQDSKLIVTGEGSSVENKDYSYSYVFHVREGGTLVFDDNFGGTFNAIRVGSGTLTSTRDDSHDIHIGTLEIADSSAKISFKQGTFDKIVVEGSNVSVKLGDLLAENSGKAFQKADGTFLRYDTPITSAKAVENVTLAACPHDSITDGTCDYCGMKYIAGTKYSFENDKWVLYGTYAGTSEADMNTAANDAIKSLNQSGETVKVKVKLFVDAALKDITVTNKNAEAIDLNGHKLTGGTMTLNSGVNLTITDSTTGKTGSFANVKVNGGAGLTVDGVAVGKITANAADAKITLKAGSKFTSFSKPEGMPLADWIEDGYGIKNNQTYENLSNADESNKDGSGAYTVIKAPATITAGTKSGEVEHGGYVPTTLLPTIEPTGETPDSYTIEWFRRTDNDTKHISSGILRKDGTFDYLVNNFKDFGGVTAGDTLQDVFCTIKAEGSEGVLWRAAVKGYTLEVTKGTATVTTPPTANDLTYTGNPQALLSDGGAADKYGTMQYSLDENGTYSTDIPKGTKAGEYTVWYKAVAKDKDTHTDSTPESKKVTIAPMEISSTPVLGNLNALIKEYDGTTAMGGAFGITGFYKTADDTTDTNKVTLTQGTDFTVDAAYKQADAGKNLEVTMNFTLKSDGNYTFANGEKSATYTSKDGYINQANAPTQGNPEISVTNKHTQTYTVDLKELLPVLSGSRSYGEVTYSTPTVNLDSYYTNGVTIDENGKLTLPIENVNSNTEGNIGTITVQITSTNYNNFTLTINVNAVNKIVPQGEPTLSATTLTYGDTLSKIKLSGTMQDGDTEVKGTFAWGNPDAKVGSAGQYAATWVFTPTNSSTYAEVTGVATITVNKATPTGTPAYDAITQSGKTLADANLTKGTITPDGTIAWVLPTDTVVTANTAYAWTFTPGDTTNYETLTGSITLYRVSSGGGGGGGSTKHTVATPSSANGKVTLDKTNVSKGALVTITPKADAGYVLDKITVVDKNGNEIKLTDMGNGTYTFTMPATAVEIKPEFKKAEETQPTGGNEKKTVVQLQIGSKQLVANGVTSEKDAAPVIRNNRTLVPIRFITESLGGKVSWNAATKEVTLLIDGKEIKMTIGKTLETYGVAPIIIGERTYVPVRFVADALGAQTAWEDATKTVTIVKETK